MLDTLEVRLVQARAGELGHQEFLQVLCEDELNRRAATAVTRRVRAARFEEQLSLEDFDFTVSAKLPVSAIRDLATLRFLDRGECVVLHGPVGVGKSHIAQALGNLACRRNLSVTFLKASRALAHLAGGHADRTWAARLRKLATVDLLILDDFGVRMLTDTQADDLYELVTERAGRSLIITSNRTPADWYPLFPNPVVAESILDRLVNTAFHIPMPGRSYRPRHRPGQPDGNLPAKARQ
ncbi:MAG: ATP-binding protein [Pseudorhodobacter sp.]|nr:ATP-binding protein [Frankiaceae bacterium]